jgi:uncharacterized protein YjbI with pentapeptide repeats
MKIIKLIFKSIYRYSGIESICNKARVTEEQQPKRILPTLPLWLIGIYIAFFGIASQRYENKVDIIENRANSIFTQIGTSARKSALGRIAKVQNYPCPVKPKIFQPVSMFRSIFGKDSVHKEMLELLRETVEDWKEELKEVDLTEANLEGANLEGANLEGANLARANLMGAVLEGANLQGANLQVANLEGAHLARANLMGANLCRANLQKADLRGANLQKVSLTEANLARADLARANLMKASLARANLEGAELQEANLEEAGLWVANLQVANLEGANLARANLQEADLRKAKNIPSNNFPW